MVTRTYRTLAAVKLMVTTLLEDWLNTRPADADRSLNEVPLTLPCTARVWVRVPQWVGSFSTTWSMAVLAPRSTWIHCGNALLALSQYDPALPSLTLPVPYGPLELLAWTCLPRARFGPPAASAAVGIVAAMTAVDRTAVKSCHLGFRVLMTSW